MNESIHSLENILAQKEYGTKPIPYLYVEFPEAEKLKLPKVALEEFSLQRHFGDLFVHYSQVGKSVLDAFEDNDIVMQESNIRPHEFYDGSFDIRFRGWSEKKVIDLTEKLSSWMKNQSYDPSDRKWAIGWLVVADLILGDQTEEDVIKSVAECCRVQSVTIDG